MHWPAHDYYERINRGVHRKASNRVGAPALVWHLGLWRTRGLDPHNWQFDQPIPPDDNIVNDYLSKLKACLSVRSDIITFDDYGHLFENSIPTIADREQMGGSLRGNISTFIFRWNRILATVRVEVHIEYVTITSILDTSISPVFSIGETENSIQSRNEIYRLIKELLNELNIGLSRRKNHVDFNKINNELYHLIWGTFEDQVLNVTPGRLAEIGGVFADFRGVITSEPFPELAYDKSTDKRNPLFMGRAFRTNARLRPGEHRNNFPRSESATGSGWSRDKVVALWPFVECNDRFREVEFTVCEFLKGRAVYISSLGPALNDKTSDALEPIRFVIHSFTDDAWQIGRLVDRLFQAGTARLSAIIELDALHFAGMQLSELEDKILKTRNDIHMSLARIGDGKSPNSDDQNKISKNFNECQELFARLNLGFMSKSIEFRTDRSVYYLEQFNTAVSALRISRIEGYHPYDEYVARRLGDSFSFIKMMQHRVREAKEDMTSLYQYFVSENIANIANGIRKRDGDIQEIQDFGELILLAVLMPYYLAYQLNHNMLNTTETIFWHFAVAVGSFIASIRLIRSLYNSKEIGESYWSFVGRKKLSTFAFFVLIIISISSIYFTIEDWNRPRQHLGNVPAGAAASCESQAAQAHCLQSKK